MDYKRKPIIDSNIILNNFKIPWLNKIKYLGLILDSKLTFAEHVKTVVQKAVTKLILLCPLINRYSKLSAINKFLIYKVIVRLALLYACPVWSMICKSHYSKLQIVQNKFLRLIGGYRRFSLISEMHRNINIEPVKDYIKTLNVSYFNKIDNHSNRLVRSIRYVNKRYKHKRLMQEVFN